MQHVRIGCLLACLSACTFGAPDVPRSSFLAGEVFDAGSGAPLVGANVEISGPNSPTLTDAQGRYSFVIVTPVPVVLTVTAPGYVPHRQLVQRPYGTVLTQLRAIELDQAATLPDAGAPPLEVALVHGDVSTTLRIDAGDLVTAAGVPATGAVQVQLTYWHPLEPLTSLPGHPQAEASPVPVRVKTWGMAGVQLLQGGQPLQVAAGQSLQWGARLPDAMNTFYGVLPPRLQPQLYSLNPQTGLWRLDGSLTFDGPTQTLQGSLAHLGEWAMNAPVGYDGGCVQGRLLNKCGHPVANGYFAVWFMDAFEVRDFRGSADASGDYCVNTGLPDAWGMSLTDPNLVTHVRTSGTDINDSSACNPLPYECQVCNEEDLSCDGCAYGLNYNSDHPGLFGDDSPMGCAPATTPVSPCHRCPGTCADANDWVRCAPAQGGPGCIEGCDVLPDVVIADPTCDSPQLPPPDPNAAQPPAVDPCAGQAKGVGALCGGENGACCSAALTCLDFRCVPLSDQ